MTFIKRLSTGITCKLLFLVAVVSAVPLSIMGGVTYFLMKGEMEEGLSTLLVETGRGTARLMDNYLLERDKELGLVTGSSTLRAGEAERAAYGLNRYLETFKEIDALIFADTQGNLITTAGNVMRTRGDGQVREMAAQWTREARAGRRVLDRAVAEEGDFPRYLLFIRPVSHEGIDYGWVFAQVDSERVAAFSMEVEIGETGRATLFNREGALIGHRVKSRYGSDMSHYPIMHDPVQRGVGNPGDFFLSGDGRIKWGMTLLLRDSMEQLGLQWGIIVDQTEQELYAPINRLNFVLWALWVIAFIVAMIAGYLFAMRLTSPLKNLLTRLHNISSGEADLTQKIEIRSRDEIGETAQAFNLFVEKLRGIVRELASESETLSASAHQMQAITEKTGRALGQQNVEVDQVATAMNEMAATVQEVAKNAQNAASGAHKATGEADSGRRVVEEAISSIDELAHEVERAAEVINGLKEDSNSISTILDVIRGIAEQTNLLALNAAIEAARAGEQGRGFAVVADEVRSLASRTQESTTEIQGMIEKLQKSADNAVGVMETGKKKAGASVGHAAQAGQSLQAISQEIHGINDMNTQIASAAEEQSAVAEEINRNIINISQLAEETARGSEEGAQAGVALTKLAEEMSKIVGRFRY